MSAAIDTKVCVIAKRATYRRALGFGFLSFASLAAFGVLTSIVLARMYGVAVIGEFALASIPLGVMIYISSAQEQTALSRQLSTLEPRAPRVTGLAYAVVGFSFLLTVTIGAVVAVGSYFLFEGPIGEPGLFLPALVLLVSYALVQNTCWNADVVLVSFRAGRQLFWIRLQQAVVFFALAVLGAAVLNTVWGLVVAWIGSWLVTLFSRLIALRGFMAFRVSGAQLREGLGELPEMIRFGIKVTPGQLFGGINAQVGTLTLGMVSSVAMVGAWSRAEQLVVRLRDASLRLQEVLLPTLVERREGGDAEGHDRALVDSIRLLLIGLLALASTAGGAAYGVMDLFGPGFSAAANALAILLLAQALAAIPACCSMCLWAAGRPVAVSAASGIASLANVGACVLFTLKLGVTGPALGALVGQVVFGGFLLRAVRRELALPLSRLLPWHEVAPLLLAYGTAFAGARLVDTVLPQVGGLLAAMTLGLVIFGVVLMLTGGLSRRERTRLAELSAVLPARIRRLSAVRASVAKAAQGQG